VPHVYGSTRAEVMFGAGWATAEDPGPTFQQVMTFDGHRGR
jgi:acyl-homoserine lactone acylase PvdQ